MSGDSSKFIVRQVTDAGQIEAALAAIADEPYMEMYRDPVFRRKHAEKLAQRAYVFVEYHDEQPVAVLALYANDFETRVGYAIILAYLSSLGLQRIRTTCRIVEALLATPAISQMRYIRLRVNMNNQRARKLYEQFGFSYTGEQDGDKLYMETEREKLSVMMENIARKFGMVKGM